MRKNFGMKTWIYPMPVLILGTYDENGVPDAMNAAWGGAYDAGKIIISLSADHKTTKNIKLKKAFTVSFATIDYVAACDYLGIVSANDEPDKLEVAGFTTSKAEFVDAPIINELPMSLECKLEKITEDGNVIAEIVNCVADEDVLDERGLPDIDLIRPIIFDPAAAAYREIGEKVGDAFVEGKSIE